MEDLFSTQLKCLRIVGHRCILKDSIKSKQQEQEKSPNNFLHFRYLLKSFNNILAVLFVATAQWPMLNYCIYHNDDLSLVTAGLSIMFTNFLGVIKISTFLRRKEEFVNIMQKLTEMFQKLQNPYAAAYILKTENTRWARLVHVYFLSTLCTGLYFMMEPLVKLFWAKVLKRDYDTIPEPPMPMRFPFNIESSPNYQLIYVYCGLLVLMVVLYSSAVDGLFMTFTVNLSAHFKVLQNFIMRHSFRRNDIADEFKLQQDISNLVRYHNILLRLATDVCQLYKPIIFGQLLMSSLNLCVIVYQLVILGQTESFMNILIYGTFMCAILLQLFIYCYGGEIVSNESLMVSTAIQLSNWYNLSPSQRRMLLMMLIRSQRAVTIRAFFYDANLANFLTILKAAMSYITLIRSIE